MLLNWFERTITHLLTFFDRPGRTYTYLLVPLNWLEQSINDLSNIAKTGSLWCTKKYEKNKWQQKKMWSQEVTMDDSISGTVSDVASTATIAHGVDDGTGDTYLRRFSSSWPPEIYRLHTNHDVADWDGCIASRHDYSLMSNVGDSMLLMKALVDTSTNCRQLGE